MSRPYPAERRLSDETNQSVNHISDIEKHLRKAIQFQEDGRLADAATIYEGILSTTPMEPLSCFNLAVIRHMNGDLPDAISLYNRVLEQDPEHFQVLFYLGNAYKDQNALEEACEMFTRALQQTPHDAATHYSLGLIHYQRGDTDMAASYYETAASIDPDSFQTQYNLGVIKFEQGDYQDAAFRYEKALALEPTDSDALYNFGLTLIRLGKLQNAADAFEKAAILSPNDADICNTLGTTYKKLHQFSKAAGWYRKAITLRPDCGKAFANLAVIHHTLGEIDEAVRCYDKAIERDHDAVSVRYMIAALTGIAQQSAPKSYVQDLFDNYAETFDESLESDLEYHVPSLLRELMNSLHPSDSKFQALLDMGCGTGLAGEEFRNLAEVIHGVDLSGKMLDKARRKNIYTQLHCADLIDFLSATALQYDVFLAADVLAYVGTLSHLFELVAARASQGALFLFSTENNATASDYVLRNSGRFAHSIRYIEVLAAEHGFAVETMQPADLRREKGEWIAGNLFALRKT